MTIPAGLFVAGEKHVFEHADRVFPIYFEYPLQKVDDITIGLSAGWQAAGLPPPQTRDARIATYELKAEGKESLHLTRKLTLDALLLDRSYYPTVQSFYQTVRTGDEQQIVLEPGAATANYNQGGSR